MPHGPPTVLALPFQWMRVVADMVELEQVDPRRVHDRPYERDHKADDKVQPGAVSHRHFFLLMEGSSCGSEVRVGIRLGMSRGMRKRAERRWVSCPTGSLSKGCLLCFVS